YRNMVVDIAHPNGQTTRAPGNPVKLSRTNADSYSPAPLLGQHTDVVLTELLGWTEQRIGELRAQGAVG
ncbi:MAG: CoA transferase, partial [Porticoccaceae bacterium]